MKKICPCKDCDEREIGCHSHCIAYKQWHTKHVDDATEAAKRKHAANAGFTKRFEAESWRKRGER